MIMIMIMIMIIIIRSTRAQAHAQRRQASVSATNVAFQSVRIWGGRGCVVTVFWLGPGLARQGGARLNSSWTWVGGGEVSGQSARGTLGPVHYCSHNAISAHQNDSGSKALAAEKTIGLEFRIPERFSLKNHRIEVSTYQPQNEHESGVSTPKTSTRVEFRPRKRPREWSFDPPNGHESGVSTPQTATRMKF